MDGGYSKEKAPCAVWMEDTVKRKFHTARKVVLQLVHQFELSLYCILHDTGVENIWKYFLLLCGWMDVLATGSNWSTQFFQGFVFEALIFLIILKFCGKHDRYCALCKSVMAV